MTAPCPFQITGDQISALYEALLVDNSNEDGTLAPPGSALLQTIVSALWNEDPEEIVVTKDDPTTKEDVLAWYIDDEEPELLSSPVKPSPVPRLSLSLKSPEPPASPAAPRQGSTAEEAALLQFEAALEAAEAQISGLEEGLQAAREKHDRRQAEATLIRTQLQQEQQGRAQAESAAQAHEGELTALRASQSQALEELRTRVSVLEAEKAALQGRLADGVVARAEASGAGSRLACKQLNANVEEHQSESKPLKGAGGGGSQARSRGGHNAEVEEGEEGVAVQGAESVEEETEMVAETQAPEQEEQPDQGSQALPVEQPQPQGSCDNASSASGAKPRGSTASSAGQPGSKLKPRQPSSMLKTPQSMLKRPVKNPNPTTKATSRATPTPRATSSTAHRGTDPKGKSAPRPAAGTRPTSRLAPDAASKPRVSPRPAAPRTAPPTKPLRAPKGAAASKSPREGGLKPKKPVARSGFGFGGSTPRLGG